MIWANVTARSAARSLLLTLVQLPTACPNLIYLVALGPLCQAETPADTGTAHEPRWATFANSEQPLLWLLPRSAYAACQVRSLRSRESSMRVYLPISDRPTGIALDAGKGPGSGNLLLSHRTTRYPGSQTWACTGPCWVAQRLQTSRYTVVRHVAWRIAQA